MTWLYAAVGAALAVVIVLTWLYVARGLRRGAEAGPVISKLEGERNAERELARRLSESPPSGAESVDILRRLLRRSARRR